MIKRLVGIVGALGVVAIVVFTILGRGGYSSALGVGSAEVSSGVEQQDVEVVVDSTAAVVDSLEMQQPKAQPDSEHLQDISAQP